MSVRRGAGSRHSSGLARLNSTTLQMLVRVTIRQIYRPIAAFCRYCCHATVTQSLSISLLSPVGNTVNVAAVTLSGATQPMAGQDLRKAKMARHASFNIAPTSVAVQRQVSSAPSSPRLEPTGKRRCGLYGVQLYSLLQSKHFYILAWQISSLTLQLCKTSPWITPKGQATVQCVDSLETALSEFILTHTHTVYVFLGLDLSAVIDHRFTAKQYCHNRESTSAACNNCKQSTSCQQKK